MSGFPCGEISCVATYILEAWNVISDGVEGIFCHNTCDGTFMGAFESFHLPVVVVCENVYHDAVATEICILSTRGVSCMHLQGHVICGEIFLYCVHVINTHLQIPVLFSVAKTRQEARLERLFSRLATGIHEYVERQRAVLDLRYSVLHSSLERRMLQEKHRLEIMEQRIFTAVILWTMIQADAFYKKLALLSIPGIRSKTGSLLIRLSGEKLR